MIAEVLRGHQARRQTPALWHHLRMGMTGFAAGSLVVIPLVLIASGHIALLPDLPVWRPPVARMPSAPVEPAALAAAANAGTLTGAPLVLVRPPEPARRPSIVFDPPLKQDTALAEDLATAHALFERGDVGRVRQILSDAVIIVSPEAAFLLAETYDPNVIAGRNLAGVNADVARARRYYASALIGGIEPARQRLKALE